MEGGPLSGACACTFPPALARLSGLPPPKHVSGVPAKEILSCDAWEVRMQVRARIWWATLQHTPDESLARGRLCNPATFAGVHS